MSKMGVGEVHLDIQHRLATHEFAGDVLQMSAE